MRQERLKYEGEQAVYHCMSKVVGGDFLLGEREKKVLRHQIRKVSRFCGIEILTYCLMDNHFHVLLRTPDESEILELSDADLLARSGEIYSKDKVESLAELLGSEDPYVGRGCRQALRGRMGDVSQFIKELKQRFTIWYNRSRPQRRTGTLWGERFKSVLVQDDAFALATVAAYIDLNSVRGGLVRDPARYRFCGYGEAMGGSREARAGLVSVVGGNIPWRTAVAKYRVVVFGKGYAVDASRPARAVSRRKAAEVMNSGGEVPLREALRCRVRYFSDGAALGSREFIADVFESRRSTFGARRRDGPRELRGSNWGGLACIRGLRTRVFG